jgi:AraC-like DNA-binding protein
MLYHIAKPSMYLSKFIKHYWTLENCIPQGKEHIQRIVPSGLLELVFYFDEKPATVGNQHSINEHTLITGQLKNYYDLKITGKISLFSIIFQPHGLSAFLDVPLHELYNQNLPFNLVFKHDAKEIETRLFEATTFAERIRIVEHYFSKILFNNALKYNFERINNVIYKINQAKGLVKIDDLASEACYSRKQFERNFATMVGTSPKQFLKIIRFQHAIARKSLNSNHSLTELTYECGYYDQAHMINDFQELSGMTPKQYFDDCEPYSDYFQ